MGGVYRWNQPVRAFIGPSTTSSVRGTAEKALREMAGEGTVSDPASGRARLLAASDLGHAQAARAYAKALRDGVGGQADAIEAFAFFDLASRRKVSAAAGERDTVAVGLSAEQRGLADARARELPTVPQR
ncbi:MAG: hypothetical protein HY059_24055 [Proteobacteria bacterium]|nr:hypothetical protein [Pseudomonadota bacterium]